MASYLLAWNPKRWNWVDLVEFVDAFNRGEVRTRMWSCGRNKSIVTGDRVWLIRLGQEPRGIFGFGVVTTPSHEDVHWEDPMRVCQCIAYQVHSIVNPESGLIIPRSRLNDPPFHNMHWDTQSSGIRIPDSIASALQDEWKRVNSEGSFSLPDEIDAATFIEGARRIVTVNSYERNSGSMAECVVKIV